ncbi:MAG: cupin domain-containing protein [Gammaproteobacteria bacterium]
MAEDVVIDVFPQVWRHAAKCDGKRGRPHTWLLISAARATSFRLRREPGARLPAHVHVADEECLVLEGELHLGEGVILKAGDYHFAPRGLPHGAAERPSGALLFLRSEKPAY